MTAVSRRVLPIDADGEAWHEFEGASAASIGARRVYAIGDVHGYLELLFAMQEAIAADLDRYPVEHALVLYLGDLIDRGPCSADVVEAIIDSQNDRRAGVDVACLRGNHDQWLVSFLEDAAILSIWAAKGGLETLVSYGLAAEDVLAGASEVAVAEKVRQRFMKLLPERHQAFMQALPLSHSEGDYFFAHAGIDPDRPLADQRREDLTWIRDKFLLSRKNFGKVVVHGHSHRESVESLPNRINVDTGAYVQQVLSCVILEGTERHLLQVGNTIETAGPQLSMAKV